MATTTTKQTEHVQLGLEGMTCASRAARIERKPSRVAVHRFARTR